MNIILPLVSSQSHTDAGMLITISGTLINWDKNNLKLVIYQLNYN